MDGLESALGNLLAQDEVGVWRPKMGDTAPVHYPDDGHQQCFALEDRSFWFQARNEIILSAVDRFRPSGEIWDIGGGNGVVSAFLLQHDFPCVLVEPGEVGAFNGKRYRKIPVVICASTGDIRAFDEQVPAIGIFDVLEHIEHESVFLEEVWHLLRPGGYLYLTVPAHRWLWSQSDIQAEHFRRHSRFSLRQCLQRNGFTIEYCSAFFRPLVIPLFLLRSLPYRLGLAKSEGNSPTTEEKQHAVDGGLTVSILKRMLRKERVRLAAGRQLAWGTSLLCVAQKPLSSPCGNGGASGKDCLESL